MIYFRARFASIHRVTRLIKQKRFATGAKAPRHLKSKL